MYTLEISLSLGNFTCHGPKLCICTGAHGYRLTLTSGSETPAHFSISMHGSVYISGYKYHKCLKITDT